MPFNGVTLGVWKIEMTSTDLRLFVQTNVYDLHFLRSSVLSPVLLITERCLLERFQSVSVVQSARIAHMQQIIVVKCWLILTDLWSRRGAHGWRHCG